MPEYRGDDYIITTLMEYEDIMKVTIYDTLYHKEYQGRIIESNLYCYIEDIESYFEKWNNDIPDYDVIFSICGKKMTVDLFGCNMNETFNLSRDEDDDIIRCPGQ